MTAPLPEERVSKIGQYVILRCSEAYESLKSGVLRLERLFDLPDPAAFQENTHLLLLGHHIQLLAAKMRRLQIFLLSEVISLKDSWNTMRTIPQDTQWQRIGQNPAVDERYADIFDRSVRTINEREMFVTIAFPPDIMPANTKDAINFVTTKFAQCARYFAAVQVFLILKNFASEFPTTLSVELKSLRAMAEQGFLSETEYSDRRLLLFDKYVPPRQRLGARTVSAPAKPKQQTGDEALAEVTRMLEESMRRTSDRRSVTVEQAPQAYPNEVLAVSTPPIGRPGGSAIKLPGSPDTYRRKTVNFDSTKAASTTATAASPKTRHHHRHATSSYATSTPSATAPVGVPPPSYALASASTPSVSAYNPAARATSSGPAPPTASLPPYSATVRTTTSTSVAQPVSILRPSSLSSVASTPASLPSYHSSVRGTSTPATAPPPYSSPGGAAPSHLPSPRNLPPPPHPPSDALKLYQDAIYAPVEPDVQPESAYSLQRGDNLGPSLSDSTRKRSGTVAAGALGASSSAPPTRPSSSYQPGSTNPSPRPTSSYVSSGSGSQIGNGSFGKATAPVYAASAYDQPSEPPALPPRPVNQRTEAEIHADIAARRRYYAQLDRQKELDKQQRESELAKLAHQPSTPVIPKIPRGPTPTGVSLSSSAPQQRHAETISAPPYRYESLAIIQTPPLSHTTSPPPQRYETLSTFQAPPKALPAVPAKAAPAPAPPRRDYEEVNHMTAARLKYEQQQHENAEAMRKKDEMMRLMNERSASQIALETMARLRAPTTAQSAPLRQVPSEPTVSVTAQQHPLAATYSSSVPPSPTPARPPARPPPSYQASLRQDPSFISPRSGDRIAKARTLEYATSPVTEGAMQGNGMNGNGMPRYNSSGDVKEKDKKSREREKKEKKEHKRDKDRSDRSDRSGKHSHRSSDKDKDKKSKKKHSSSSRKDKTTRSTAQS